MTTSRLCGARVAFTVGVRVGGRGVLVAVGETAWVGVAVESRMSRKGTAVCVDVAAGPGTVACPVLRASFSRNKPTNTAATAARLTKSQRTGLLGGRDSLIVSSAGILLLCSAVYTWQRAYSSVRQQFVW